MLYLTSTTRSGVGKNTFHMPEEAYDEAESGY
jgi:hypothetical protein